MQMGIEVRPGVFVSYRKISLVKKVAENSDAYEITLIDGEKIRFNNREKFERIKNYLTVGHPVTDEPGRGGRAK